MQSYPDEQPSCSSRAGSRVSRICKLPLLLAIVLPGAIASVSAATFVVNSAADVPDATPGDGVCETATNNNVCTLRAAVQESNALAGADTIQLQSGVTYLLVHQSLRIQDSVSVNGAGASNTIIDGDGNITSDRVFTIDKCIDDQVDSSYSCIIGKLIAQIHGVTIKNGLSDFGAGIQSDGDLTITDSIISDNVNPNYEASYVGAVADGGSLDLERSTVSNNVSGDFGAIWVESGASATIVACTIAGNSEPTGGYGGGLAVSGTATVRDSVIKGNSAQDGGGIYQVGALDLINSTVYGNTSSDSGGGVFIGNSAVSTNLYNATITGNEANADANTSGSGGGVAANGGGYFQNTIIADNWSQTSVIAYPDDCSGFMDSLGYNVVSAIDTSHCTLNGAVTVADPKLGPLQNNGGPTDTQALLAGSPAIDAGNPSGCTDELGATLTTDQRGYPRPSGAACDIGAFEFQDTIFKNGFELNPAEFIGLSSL